MMEKTTLAGVGQLYMLSHGRNFSFDNTLLQLKIKIGKRIFGDLGEYSGYWQRAGVNANRTKHNTAILKAGKDFYIFTNFRGHARNVFKGQAVGGACALFNPQGEDLLKFEAFSWISENDMAIMFGSDWQSQDQKEQLRQMSRYRMLLALKNQGYNGIQSQMKKLRQKTVDTQGQEGREIAKLRIQKLMDNKGLRDVVLARYAYRIHQLIAKDPKFLSHLKTKFGDVREVARLLESVA